ncbi:DUF5677 domain-containing protein [Cytobacillus gottheilii]|uniref:DUF5677 domain-containing protein n=1 Tax=Cytobacillus gottheilii TaxID=859144 RepID=UPI0009BAF441|nr:DUF5677 domain-containing protein [Cytobacillus gottheilii]
MFGINIQTEFKEIFNQKTAELSGNRDELDVLLEGLPHIMDRVINESADLLYNSIMEGINEIDEHEEKLINYYQENVTKDWKEALKLLKAIIRISEEASEEILNELKRGEYEDQNNLIYFVLFKIHSRSISISKEINLLLSNGYADGALARWRSLHESAIVFILLTSNFNNKDFTYNIIERYIDYSAIEVAKEVKKLSLIQSSEMDNDYFKKIEKRKRELLSKYGKDFYYDNFWAAPLFGNKKGKIHFYELARKAGMGKLNQYYMKASQQVHLSPKGLVENLSIPADLDSSKYLLYGSSLYGLSVPLQLTADSLIQITTNFILLQESLDRVVFSKFLSRLAKECKIITSRINTELLSKVNKTNSTREEG